MGLLPARIVQPASTAYAFCLGVRPRLDVFYAEALALIPDGPAKEAGKTVGLTAAANIIALRSGDGRITPLGVTSPFPTLPPGPSVWRLTPPFAAPQTPWVGNVRRLRARERRPVPARRAALATERRVGRGLQRDQDLRRIDRQRAHGRADPDRAVLVGERRPPVQPGRARLTGGGDNLVEAARLMAMVNLVGADALMSTLYAKYYYLFWRPVTAIDPVAVTADGFGPVPGYDDGNRATVEQTGWRPLLTTPNHPEYPAAPSAITSAMAEVFRTFLGTNQIGLDIHGFDAGVGQLGT